MAKKSVKKSHIFTGGPRGTCKYFKKIYELPLRKELLFSFCVEVQNFDKINLVSKLGFQGARKNSLKKYYVVISTWIGVNIFFIRGGAKLR